MSDYLNFHAWRAISETPSIPSVKRRSQASIPPPSSSKATHRWQPETPVHQETLHSAAGYFRPLHCWFELLTTTGVESAVLVRATNRFKIIDGRQTLEGQGASVSKCGSRKPRCEGPKQLRKYESPAMKGETKK